MIRFSLLAKPASLLAAITAAWEQTHAARKAVQS